MYEQHKKALIWLASERFNAAAQTNINLTPEQRQYNHNSYKERYEKSINAITNSIFEGTFGDQESEAGRFSKEAITAMRGEDFTIVREGGLGGGDLHAELKLLQSLANRDDQQQGNKSVLM